MKYIYLICVHLCTLTTAATDVLCRDNEDSETCYHYVSSPETWDAANVTCYDQFGGELLEIKDQETHNYILNWLTGSDPPAGYDKDNDEPWIGARRETFDKWQWLDGDPAADTFSRWASGYPKGDNYVQLNKATGYFWTDYGPATRLTYICEWPNATLCESQTGSHVAVEADGRCFYAYTRDVTAVTWYDARRICSEKGVDPDKGFLAKLDSDAVFVPVQGALNASTDQFSNGLWIGMYREDWFLVSDNTPMMYANWDTFYPAPSGECAHLSTPLYGEGYEVYWRNRDCTTSASYVCQTTYVFSTSDKPVETRLTNDGHEATRYNVVTTITTDISSIATTPTNPDVATTPTNPDVATTLTNPDVATTLTNPDAATTLTNPDVATTLTNPGDVSYPRTAATTPDRSTESNNQATIITSEDRYYSFRTTIVTSDTRQGTSIVPTTHETREDDSSYPSTKDTITSEGGKTDEATPWIILGVTSSVLLVAIAI